MSDKCDHKSFAANVAVARLEDVKRFNAEVRIHCTDCGKPFAFLGLEPGLNLAGAAVSPDGLEARLAITPDGEQPNPMQLMGFSVGKA